jgi:single-strand DNA-binding protein
MINRVILVGRLTRDPELKRTTNGTPVTSFTIAVDNRMKGPDGVRTASFFSCVCWNQTAENTAKFIHKGSLVAIDGRLNQRSYDRPDGSGKTYVTEVICESVQFLDTRKDGGSGGSSPSYSKGSPRDEASPAYEPDMDLSPSADKSLDAAEIAEDDLPF